MWEVCFVDWNNHLVFCCCFFKLLHSCSFHWNVFFYYLYFYSNFMLIFGYRLQLFGSALRLVVSCSNSATQHCVALLLGLRLLLGYHNYYSIHRNLYMSAHVLIENTLVQHKIVKNSCMALCCWNQVSNQHYGLHISAIMIISVHSGSVTVLGLLKKEKKKKQYVQNGVFAAFRLAT